MPDFLPYFIIAFAVSGLLCVIFEEVIHISKSITVLCFGTFSWILLFAATASGEEHSRVVQGLDENIGEIASLWLFLTAAMTFVAYLNKKGLIESLIYKFLPNRISERALLLLTGGFAFIFSSLADNITATLISITLVLSLNLTPQKTLRFAVVVIFAVNSGGVSMITGDVTTLMIFLDNKATITNLLFLSIPAVFAVLLLMTVLARPLSETVLLSKESQSLERVDIVVAVIFISTILSTIALNVYFGIPPVLTFLGGLSLMFFTAHLMGEDSTDHPIMDYVRRIEFDTLMFFLGILLLVGALKEIHALDSFVRLYDFLPAWQANYLMGLLSALIDNVPLTAALLKSDVIMSSAEWLALTYAVGVGGSLLVVGSAAGIVAMSKVSELTFASYLKFILALLFAYTAGYLGSLGLGYWIVV